MGIETVPAKSVGIPPRAVIRNDGVRTSADQDQASMDERPGERMNRTIKEATVQRYHYDRYDQLEAHLADFVNAYNYARRLKALKGLMPYEYICKCWTSQPERFKLNPLQKMPGLNT